MGGLELNNTIPDKIKSVNVPKQIFKDTIMNFQKNSTRHQERIAYWTGILANDTAMIKNVIFADDYAEFEHGPFSASMPILATLKVGEEVHRRNEILIAQVHSHPKEAFHSFTDNTYPISHRIGFLSVVAPNYGNNVKDFSNCKIFEYKGNGKWHELSSKEVSSRFLIGVI